MTKFILAGDRINAMVYANHIETELRHRAGSNEDRIVLANDALRQLVDMILKKQAYLRFYVCFRPLWQLDVLEPIPERIVSDFGEKVMAISEAIAPFQLHTKNELVRKACLILLEGQGVGSLREVAGQLYSNPKYLGSLMKKELGMSFIQYATFIRTERSKLLLSGSDKIYEIAHAMGYNDVEYFSRVFKRHTGESPSAFRERCY